MNNQDKAKQSGAAPSPMSPLEPQQFSSQKWLPWVIVIVLAVLVGGGVLGYQYWWASPQEPEPASAEPASQTELEPKPGSTPAFDETADWQTYRNEEYGFEMKYVPAASVQTGSDDQGLPYANITVSDNELFGGVTSIRIDVKKQQQRYIYKGLCTSSLDIRKRESGKRVGELDEVDVVQTRVARFMREEGLASGMGGTATYANSVSFSTKKEDVCISINFIHALRRHVPIPPFDEQVRNRYIDMTISTFRFLNIENETAGWKSYRNEEYGLEISYPAFMRARYHFAKDRNREELIMFRDPFTGLPETDKPFNGISISIDENSEQLNFQDYINQEKNSQISNYRAWEEKDPDPAKFRDTLISLGGKNGRQLEGYSGGRAVHMYIPLIDNEILHIMKMESVEKDFDSQFNQIIFTLRFFGVVESSVDADILSPSEKNVWVIDGKNVTQLNRSISASLLADFHELALIDQQGKEIETIVCKIETTGEDRDGRGGWNTIALSNYCGTRLAEKEKVIQPGFYKVVGVTKNESGRLVTATKSDYFLIVAP